MKQLKVVLKFEYLNYLRSKSFVITTLVLGAAIVLLSSLPAIIGMVQGLFGSLEKEETGSETAAFYDPAGLYDAALLEECYPGYQWVQVENLEGVEQAIETEEYAMALSLEGLRATVYRRGTDSMFTSDRGLETVVKTAYQRSLLGRENWEAEKIDAFFSPQVELETVAVGKDLSQTYWISYVLLMLLYVTTIMYGQYVTVSVVTEKSSKAMELLITSAKPTALMFGKVFGTGLAGLTQFGFILLVGLGSILLQYNLWQDYSPAVSAILDVAISSNIFLYAIVFFLLGFFSFAFIYAAMGSTVSRMEEASSSQMIPMLLFIAAFLVAISGLGNPEATYVTVCSYLPFFSPLIMFLRICTIEIPTAQILLAIGLNILYILAAGFVSAKIYRVGVMLYGKKPKLKDILGYIVQA